MQEKQCDIDYKYVMLYFLSSCHKSDDILSRIRQIKKQYACESNFMRKRRVNKKLDYPKRMDKRVGRR
jgi:hypothetical protein